MRLATSGCSASYALPQRRWQASPQRLRLPIKDVDARPSSHSASVWSERAPMLAIAPTDPDRPRNAWSRPTRSQPRSHQPPPRGRPNPSRRTPQPRRSPDLEPAAESPVGAAPGSVLRKGDDRAANTHLRLDAGSLDRRAAVARDRGFGRTTGRVALERVGLGNRDRARHIPLRQLSTNLCVGCDQSRARRSDTHIHHDLQGPPGLRTGHPTSRRPSAGLGPNHPPGRLLTQRDDLPVRLIPMSPRDVGSPSREIESRIGRSWH